MPLSTFNLTIEDGIILYLMDYSKLAEDFEVPFDITQHGIADALGIRRSHVSYALKGLKTKDYVSERIAHVKDIVRKRKVYFLTSPGMEYARKIKSNVEQKSVKLIDKSGKASSITLSAVNTELSTKLSLLELLTLSSSDGILDSAEIERYEKSGKLPPMAVQTDSGLVKFIDNMAQPVRFIGRKAEQEQIKTWLNSGLPRIIVIKGIPGIGKTTLAAEVIKEVADEGNKNLFWFRFHEWDTLRSTLTELAEFMASLGKQKLKFYLNQELEIELPDIRKILEADLAGLNAVLLFDDFQRTGISLKQLFNMFVELLDSEKFKEINMLILTRGATGFYDRREVAINKLIAELELTGLDSKESKQLLNLESIQDSEFNNIFKITEGHPLSLELISLHLTEKAGAIKTGDLINELDIGELFKDQHDINKYIREEIFNKLSPAEKKLLSKASVFRYPVLPEAFFSDNDLDYECIDSLAGISLLHETTSGYDLHELIKEFFYHRLTPQLRKQYHTEAANYYFSELELDRELLGSELVPSPFSILEAQYHYLRAGNYENVGKLVVKYGDLLIGKGYTEELIVILTELNPEKVSTETWPELLIHKGQIITINGEWDRALRYFQDSLSWCQEHGNNCGLARAYNAIGAIYYRKGNLEQAMEFYEKGLGFAEPESDDWNSSRLYSNMALIHWGKGDLDQAIDLIKKSLGLSEKLKDKKGIARAHNNLGIIYWEQKKFDEAINYYNKSLELSEELGDKQTIAILYDNLGEVYRLKNDHQKAEEYYQKSLELSEDLGFKWQIAEVNCNLGILYKDIDRNKSKNYLNTSLDLYSSLGAKREEEKVKGLMGKK